MLVDDSVAFLQACAAELNLGGVQNSESRYGDCQMIQLSEILQPTSYDETSQKGCLVV